MKYLEIVNKLGGMKPVYGEGDRINLNELNKLQSVFLNHSLLIIRILSSDILFVHSMNG